MAAANPLGPRGAPLSPLGCLTQRRRCHCRRTTQELLLTWPLTLYYALACLGLADRPTAQEVVVHYLGPEKEVACLAASLPRCNAQP